MLVGCCWQTFNVYYNLLVHFTLHHPTLNFHLSDLVFGDLSSCVLLVVVRILEYFGSSMQLRMKLINWQFQNILPEKFLIQKLYMSPMLDQNHTCTIFTADRHTMRAAQAWPGQVTIGEDRNFRRKIELLLIYTHYHKMTHYKQT
jgi:hypothetical protein